jgi:hypothetical protein
MGKTYKFERGRGKPLKKKRANKKITSSPEKKVPKRGEDEFWDDPKLWENDAFERFKDRR